MIRAPKVIIDKKIAQKNIRKMLSLCQGWKMDFRPHFKTHQSAVIGEWFRAFGVHKCTVSSVGMAAYFAKHHWDDICIAIPVNIKEIEDINTLAQKVNLLLTVDHIETVLFLKEHLSTKVSLFIEIDTGYGRSGVYYQHEEQISRILNVIKKSPFISFHGFLSHTGNTYQGKDAQEISVFFEQARQRMLYLKNIYKETYPNLVISLGDTPSSAFAKDFSGIDEWRPGNFVFYDFMQYVHSVCKMEEIALMLHCPIIGIYPERNEVVIYGGGVHFSKESITYHGQKVFGMIYSPNIEHAEEAFKVVSLSQEHGIISVSKDFIEQLSIGDILKIIPIHSCLTADLYGHYLTDRGDKIEKYRTNK